MAVFEPTAPSGGATLKNTTSSFPANRSTSRVSILISKPLDIFTIYLVLLTGSAFLSGHLMEAVVVLEAILLALFPRIALRSFNIAPSVILECMTALVVMGTLILGELSHFYERIWWWDLLFHALSGCLIAYVAYGILCYTVTLNHASHRIVQPLMLLFSLLISLGVSGGWEVYEFSIDALFGTHMQPSMEDTMQDLLAGTAGAVTGMLIGRKKKDFTLRSSITDYHTSGRRMI